MEKNDINYYNENKKIKLNFRVSAIIKHKDNYLFQKNDDSSFWSLVGGRVSIGEDTLTALQREIFEETGVKFSISDFKLLRVIENFFTLDNIKYHEILFIYVINANKELINKNDFKTLDKDTQMNHWFNINDLEYVTVEPVILKDLLDRELFEHLILKDDEIQNY